MVWRPFPEFGLLLTHVPIHESGINPEKYGLNVHGHIHEKASPKGPYRNVSVEAIGYTPVNIEEISQR